MNAMRVNEGPEGVTLKVKVKPKGKQNAVLGVRGDALLVSVTVAPERGKANQACIALLAQILKVPKSAIEIISGETHPEKVMRVRGLTSEQAQERLLLAMATKNSRSAPPLTKG